MDKPKKNLFNSNGLKFCASFQAFKNACHYSSFLEKNGVPAASAFWLQMIMKRGHNEKVKRD